MPSILKISRVVNGEPEELSLPGGSVSHSVSLSAANTRAGVIEAGEPYAVPGYVVGSGQLQLWLDGILCMEGADADTYAYAEVGDAGNASASVVFHQNIPATIEIFVRVSV